MPFDDLNRRCWSRPSDLNLVVARVFRTHVATVLGERNKPLHLVTAAIVVSGVHTRIVGILQVAIPIVRVMNGYSPLVPKALACIVIYAEALRVPDEIGRHGRLQSCVGK